MRGALCAQGLQIMISSFAGFERQRLAQCRLLDELLRRRLPGGDGWSHRGAQFGAEPTALALLALHSGSIVLREGIEPLMARQGTDGLWSAIGDSTGVNFWATALAVNTLAFLGAEPATYTDSVEALIRARPMEASWLVSFEIPISRPARSVRPAEVRLALGPRHGELGRADGDGSHCTGTGQETRAGPWQRTSAEASPRDGDPPRSSMPGWWVERRQRRSVWRAAASTC